MAILLEQFIPGSSITANSRDFERDYWLNLTGFFPGFVEGGDFLLDKTAVPGAE
ncbi:MAG: hypothetical protein HY848_10845 [Betaproteobacteria bacterium]|nr:hypothetical protein [Betaproteobacteria bacterium]